MRECEVVRVRERERSTHTPTIISKDTVTAKVIVPIHTSDLPHTPIFFTTCISTLCKSVRGSHYVCMCEW